MLRLLALLALFLAGPKEVASMTLTSPAFQENGSIPSRHTCDGDDVSPALQWGGVPAGTKSLALVVADPDAPDPKAPKMTWVHWVLYDLPADAQGLPEGGKLPDGTREGNNDWNKPGWRGPCPPVGRHRYVHTLYALDIVLPDLGHPTRAKLLTAMEGHVVGTAKLIGTYQHP
ncbi:MAG TPA: YbhB/YbcL family Raf kinase inhibitor-like protein [Candidatus Polarisedimenticolaceae bacterium]|nr:YbhB/YbcL family Raf kinase inhibitor-like protein [Candidatus Polarisedimenticolaceae bacterium]